MPEKMPAARMPRQDCTSVRQTDMAQAGMARAQANPFRERAGTARAWVSIHREQVSPVREVAGTVRVRVGIRKAQASMARAQASMARAQVNMIRAQARIPSSWLMARWARSKIREDIPTAAVRIYPITDADRFRSRLRKILSRADLTVKGGEADQEDQEDREDQENREDREDPAAVSRSLRFWQACFLR